MADSEPSSESAVAGDGFSSTRQRVHGLLDRIADSVPVAVARLLLQASPGYTIGQLSVIILMTLSSLAGTVASGFVVGSIPGVFHHGIESPAGHRLLVAISVSVGIAIVTVVLTGFQGM